MKAEDRGPAELRQRLLADLKNVELRRKYLARRGPALARADSRFARRRILAVELMHGTAGLAMVGALGGTVGSLALAGSVRSSGAYAVAFQVGIGSVLVAGTVFAILGALGHVLFADVVGDFRAPSGEAGSSLGDRFADLAVEFSGGATWGIVCGMIIGVVVAALGPAFNAINAAPTAPTLAGATGGAVLGLALSLLAALFRRVRAPAMPPPISE